MIKIVILILCFFLSVWVLVVNPQSLIPQHCRTNYIILNDEYTHKISSIIREAMYYLDFRLARNAARQHTKPLAIVVNVEGHMTAHVAPYLLALYQFARAHRIAIFFITTTGPQAFSRRYLEGMPLLSLAHSSEAAKLGYDVAVDIDGQMNFTNSFADMQLSWPALPTRQC